MSKLYRMKSNLLLTSIVVLSLPLAAKAQRGDTTLKPTTIEVIQSYKPEVKQVPKPEFQPEMPPRDTARPVFKYEVPQQTLYYSYTSLPLRPLALGRDTSKLPFSNYVKIGGGNLSTIYADAGFRYSMKEGSETAIHLHHLSQKGSIPNQQISLSGAELEGMLHRREHAIGANLNLFRNQYHYYGYDHALVEYDKEDVSQVYKGLEAGLSLKNEMPNRLGTDYNPMFSVYYYADAFDASETNIALNVPFTKTVDSSFSYGVGLAGTFTTLSVKDLTSVNNNVLQATPFIAFQKENIRAKAGLYPTLGEQKNYLLPDLQLFLRIPNSQFSVTAGYEAKLKQNTYRQLSMYNPYMYNIYETKQTKTDEVYGMLQTNLGNHITLSGRVAWKQFENLPLFLNDEGDLKNFYIVYDEKVNAISFNAAAQYQLANIFSAGASLTLTNFTKHTYDEVWHEPGMTFKADMMYRPLPALTIMAYAQVMDQLYALNRNHETIKLDPTFDLGGSAEYQIIPRLSAFVNVHNLLNNRYERWYRYEAFGINIFGGLRVKF